MINFTEKLCIAYTCCGPTYRKSALDRLTNVYFSHPNLYYSILTDDKSYFKDVKLDNLVIHELKDYYDEFPALEKNEPFLESTSEKDYGDKFYKVGYRFPFSTYRFHLLEAIKFGVTNVAMLSTDIRINLGYITDIMLSDKNSCEALTGYRPISSTEGRTDHITEIVKRKYNLEVSDHVIEFDGAARLFVFEDTEFMRKFFDLWNGVVETLYEEGTIYISYGTYVVHDEFILSIVCGALGIHPPAIPINSWGLYYCYEISKFERFWTYPKVTDYPGKFVMAMTGPLMTYRLELLRDACPSILRDYLIIFTDRYSYYTNYEGYHNIFDFVLIDDYRKDYPISLKYEILPEFKTQNDFLKNINNLYGPTTGNYYPYDISRFIFLYMMEHNALNFCIVCSDTILYNDIEQIKKCFENIPSGVIYGQWMGEDLLGMGAKQEFWKNDIQPLFPQIKLESPSVSWCDGFLRGFNFRNKDEMKLYFELWNTALETLFTKREYYDILSSNNGIIFGAEWIPAYVSEFFKHQLQYEYTDYHKFMEMDGITILKHCSRPDDTFYLNNRMNVWPQFDYSDKSSISAFIRNNREKLLTYFQSCFPNCEATDNYIYTRLS